MRARFDFASSLPTRHIVLLIPPFRLRARVRRQLPFFRLRVPLSSPPPNDLFLSPPSRATCVQALTDVNRRPVALVASLCGCVRKTCRPLGIQQPCDARGGKEEEVQGFKQSNRTENGLCNWSMHIQRRGCAAAAPLLLAASSSSLLILASFCILNMRQHQ